MNRVQNSRTALCLVVLLLVATPLAASSEWGFDTSDPIVQSTDTLPDGSGIVGAGASESELPPNSTNSSGKGDENASKSGAGLRNVDLRPNVDDPSAIDSPDESVEVVFELSNASAAHRATLERMGASITARYRTYVQGVIEVRNVTAYRNLSWVDRVRRPYRPTTNVVSEGVSVINADDLHRVGVTGQGVDVGIIDVGFDPSNPEIRDNVVANRSFAGSIAGSDTSHGTAVAEVLADTAPDANLYVATIDSTVTYAIAVQWLREQGVDVISASLGWSNGPLDGTAFYTRATDEAARAGHMPVISAGNEAFQHWEGPYTDEDGDAYMEFADGDETNALNRGNELSGEVIVTLLWDDWPVSDEDYDLELYRENPDGSETLVAESNASQTGNQEPWEQIHVDLQRGNYSVKVLNYDANGSNQMELYFYPDVPEHVVQASSMEAPATGFNVTAVGAFHYRTGLMEWFSSHGPTNDGRVGIDVVAPDGVTTTANDQFFGTSASTPYVAGVAALLKSVNESLSPDQIESLLKETATDVAPPGVDTVSGYGKVDALAAYQAIPGQVTDVQLNVTANRTRVERNGSVEFAVTRTDTGEPVNATVVIDSTFRPGDPEEYETGPDGLYVHQFTRNGFFDVTVRKAGTANERFLSDGVTVQVVPPANSVQLNLTANRTSVPSNGTVEFRVTRTDTGAPVNATIWIRYVGAGQPPGGDPGVSFQTGPDGRLVHQFPPNTGEFSSPFVVTASKAPTGTETFLSDSRQIEVLPASGIGTITLGNGTGEPGQNVTLDLSATATDVTAFQANVTFDPDVLRVVSVTGQFGNRFNYRTSDAGGWVSLAGVSETNVTDPALANVTFAIVGRNPTATPIAFVREQTRIKRGNLGTDVPLAYEDGSVDVTGCRYGDANADGAVDVGDAVTIHRFVTGAIAQLPGDPECADVNADGTVDNRDVILVFRYVLGFVDQLPAN